MNTKLYQKVQKFKLPIKHVAEVGVYYPETSNVLGFINDGVCADLFEPDPLCIEKIKAYFNQHPHVKVHPYAIYHENTTIALYRTNASTFVETLSVSPALMNDNYIPNSNDKFYAEARCFADFDDGTIDLLSIDTEGCEWYVLQTLVSRPMIISAETHYRKYKNPFIHEIQEWMDANQYKVWYKDTSDTVYIQSMFKPKRWFSF